MFRTLTGIRHKTRRRQVTSIPGMFLTLGAASSTVIPRMAANTGMPVTNANLGQEALTRDLDVMEEQELSVTETTLPATTASNESQ